MKTRQWTVVLVCSLLAALLLVGCGDGSTPASTDAGAERVLPPTDRTAIDGVRPDAAAHDRLKGDARAADAAPPDGARPDGAGPDGPKPDAPRPDTVKPDGPPPVPPFNPTSDTQLAAGTHLFSSVTIAAGVTVTVDGDVVITSQGGLSVGGRLVGDCTRIELRAGEDIAVLGTVSNKCVEGSAQTADLLIYGPEGGNASLALGTPQQAATLETSGQLDVASDPSIKESSFDVLPAQRPSSPVSPVCSARSDILIDTPLPGAPVEVAFTGNAVDPDGGEVTYRWDFGDGATSTEKNPVHAYSTVGPIPVTLQVTDDEGNTCQAGLRLVTRHDDPETEQPPDPAVWAIPFDLVVEAGQPLLFASAAHSSRAGDLTFTWGFGDGEGSSARQPVHGYVTPGRYEVTLMVDLAGGNGTIVNASVYVAPALPLPLSPRRPAGDCVTPGPNVFNAVYSGGNAATGNSGSNARFRGRGDVFLFGGTSLRAQNGGPGQNRTGSGTVVGTSGNRGGNLQILVDGTLTVCGGASLASGSGGKGGDATSTASEKAYARGGNGGPAAELLRIAATDGLDFVQAPFGAPVVLEPGSGGAGGGAEAKGKDGESRCPTAGHSGTAEARGGSGGPASKVAVVTGKVSGAGNMEVRGGLGGHGGAAGADSGAGGEAKGCQTTAAAGRAKLGMAFGGDGGEALFSNRTPAIAFGLAADAFTAGSGGKASGSGGAGGEASATGQPCAEATAVGGMGGVGHAMGGDGAPGRHSGAGGKGEASGGKGGAATAVGGACAVCAGNGGPGNATGGDAGAANAWGGAAGGADAAKGAAEVVVTAGGAGDATGGEGGSCVDEVDCPGSALKKGGDGGAALARGGKGGKGNGGAAAKGGNGGIAYAEGGVGGKGAVCCKDPKKGGDGGAGGDATSVSGEAGGPGGVQPANQGGAGDGGKGGCGRGPGVGGQGGKGAGTPNDLDDGTKGADGEDC